MKKIILMICLAAAGIVDAKAQTRVVVGKPAARVLVATTWPVIVRPARVVTVRPAVVVRPAVAVVRPAVRRRVVVVHR